MRQLTRGTILSIVIAVAIVAVAGTVPLLSQQPEPEPISQTEFQSSQVVADPIQARGDVQVELTAGNISGTVVIDNAHGNRFTRADIQPLTAAIQDQGYDVRFHGSDDLKEDLADADAYVIVDPSNEYTEEELEVLKAFVNDGGRLLILGEPTRVQVSASLFGVTISDVESALTTLGSAFNVTFDTRYVYDLSQNDGNYKRPVVAPARDVNISPVREDLSAVEDVTFYTAAPVRPTGDGTPVLLTHGSARIADSDDDGRVPVAARDENVLAIGDSTFIGPDTYNVADNEVFLGRVVEFLIGSHRRTPPDEWAEMNVTES